MIHIRFAGTNQPWCDRSVAADETMTDEPAAATCPPCREALRREIVKEIARLQRKIGKPDARSAE